MDERNVDEYDQAPADLRTWCGELRLDAPRGAGLPVLPPVGYRRARVLVRQGTAPLGFLEMALPPAAIFAAALEDDLRAAAADAFGAAAAVTPVPAPRAGHPLPTVSIVVCTRNRAASLAGCLDALAAVNYPNLEIVIIDNAPVDDSTHQVVAGREQTDPRFRYVLESRPGLSRARNAGMRAATGEIIAYTDDDVTVDAGWIDAVVAGFAAGPHIACVTGMVASRTLDTPAESYFDARVSWADRCRRQVYDLADGHTGDLLYPYSAGIFGTGANVAFRAAALQALGGFDEALGAGALPRGGEDLDVFVRVLLAGYALAYEPSSLVWHHHRADAAALRRQMFAYGTGLTAYLVKYLAHPATRGDILRRVPRGAARIAGISRRMSAEAASSAATGSAGQAPGSASRATAEAVRPRGLLMRELAGMAYGPVLYARARLAGPHNHGRVLLAARTPVTS